MAAILLTITGAAWLALEIALLVRDRRRGTGGTGADRGTRAANFILIIAAVVAADVITNVSSPRSPLWLPGAGTHGWPVIAGLVIIWAGLATRIWAVATLGRAFRTTVEVDQGQAVVTRGPYRWVRHPSYTGLLLIAAGFGLAFSTWPGLVLCIVLPAAAMRNRIRVEEAELTRVLGEPYRSYQLRTRRLLPGLW
jgi:protein-S-isoprenylcysteine O-methyltransferase Ste14